MFNDMKKEVKDWQDEEEVRAYLKRLLHKEAFDQKGLIYGMGHAIYSVSDPRAEVFKGYVETLAREKGRMKDYGLYSMVERLAPEVIAVDLFTVCWICRWSYLLLCLQLHVSSDGVHIEWKS